jgi:hypothetical protein
MGHGLRRFAGAVVVLAGIAFAAWLVFGSPYEWEGDLRLVRIALGLVSLGTIGGGARLMFPDAAEDGSGHVSR